MRKMIPVIVVLFLLAGCAKAAPEIDERCVIREMVNTYVQNPTSSKNTIQSKLSELSPETRAKWQKIMDYWQYVNSGMAINTEHIPEGLPEDDSLCIIVLGFQLNPDGSMQPELIGRLEKALECAEAYPQAYVLCTGGGTASKNRDTTEAGVMAAWLNDHGVSRNRLIIEDGSLSTTQNALYSWKILLRDYSQINSVLLVTSDYHIPWGAVLFETQFILGTEDQAISIVGNAACVPPIPASYNVLMYQASGILEIAGISRR